MGISQTIQERENQLKAIKAALARFPDLVETRDRWGHTFFFAPSAAAFTTQCETGRTCGCCPDASLRARPFLELEGLQIYAASPEQFIVGEYTEWGASYTSTSYAEQMRKAGIPQLIIDKATAYLDARIQEAKESASEESGEDA